ncbi:unnamed protein product [Polarella glacialis]|uniref:Uncharacterized protein n=1 Tax=Polarella glacialis TaxID=89957 RepID=A0A813IBJ5_POLGL|nr:unnamed protein product [Polarella glacialis]
MQTAGQKQAEDRVVADAQASPSKGPHQGFLQMCLGSVDSELGDISDTGSDFDEVEEPGKTDSGAHQVFAMAMDDSDDEYCSEAGSDDDLDDAYNFDPDKVADLLKNGCSQAEISEKLQEAMAKSLERRLEETWVPSARDQLSLDNPYGYAVENTRPTCEDDLAGRMTPPREPSPERSAVVDSADVATRFAQAQAAAAARNGRGRRSSAVRRDAIQTAMAEAATRHRRSIVAKASATVGADAEESAVSKIQEAMQSAQKRHRQSICKAAEALECAGMADHPEVADKLGMVQKAMEDARRRHRRSIAEAVCFVEQTPHLSAAATVFVPKTGAELSVQERIQQAVAAAHQRARGEACLPGQGWANKNNKNDNDKNNKNKNNNYKQMIMKQV